METYQLFINYIQTGKHPTLKVEETVKEKKISGMTKGKSQTNILNFYTRSK